VLRLRTRGFPVRLEHAGYQLKMSRTEIAHLQLSSGRVKRPKGDGMALTLQDVRCDPGADRALKELMRRYAVAEGGSGLVLTAKAGNMKLFLNKLDDLHQWDFVYVQKLRASSRKTYEALRKTREERENWKRRALMAETNVVEAAEERENWKRRALMAETKVVEAAASPRSGQVVSDLKYATLKRWLAKQFHPDCAPGNGFEKGVRNEIFKEIWSEIDRLGHQSVSACSTSARSSSAS
jgi:hypothetical protein